MAIMSLREENILRIYRCPVCQGVYQAQLGPDFFNCAVNHPSGSCCHYEEIEVIEEQLVRIRKILKSGKEKE